MVAIWCCFQVSLQRGFRSYGMTRLVERATQQCGGSLLQLARSEENVKPENQLGHFESVARPDAQPIQ